MAGDRTVLVYPGLGERLNALLFRRRVTRSELAEQAGVSRQTVNVALSTDAISRTTAGMLAMALGVSRDELLVASPNGEADASAPAPDPAESDTGVNEDGAAVSGAGVVREGAARHAQHLPHRVRVFLKEFELELTKAGASDEEVQAARKLLLAPEVFSYFSRSGPREHTEDDVLLGMEALAQVVRAHLTKQGRRFK